jgi:hypothetical protein
MKDMKFSKLDQFLKEHMNVIIRKCKPNRCSKEPYGTQWHQIHHLKPTLCYVQISKEEGKPHWARLGYMLEAMLFDKTEDVVFMEECINRYKQQNKLR